MLDACCPKEIAAVVVRSPCFARDNCLRHRFFDLDAALAGPTSDVYASEPPCGVLEEQSKGGVMVLVVRHGSAFIHASPRLCFPKREGVSVRASRILARSHDLMQA